MRVLLLFLLLVIIISSIQKPTQYQSKADVTSPHVIIDSQTVINQLHPYFSGMENGPGYFNSAVAQAVKNYGGLGALRIMTGSFAQSRFFYSYTGTNPSYKILAQDNTPFFPNTEYAIKLVYLNNQIHVWINNSRIFTIEADPAPSGCPTLLTTHDWNSTHYFKDLTYQRIDTSGNPQGSPVILTNSDNSYYLIDESPSGDFKSGPARRITLNGFGDCSTLGSNYSFSTIIKVNNNTQYGSGYLGLGLFGEKYSFLWNDGRDCLNPVQCGGLSNWNNRKIADELKMADELGTTPYFAITGRMSSQQLAAFMSDLQNSYYNGKDYLTPILANGVFLEVGDEEYLNDYKNNPQGYAQKINEYAQTVKNISPNIKIGYTAFFDNNYYAMGCIWDRTLLPLIIDSIDFIALSQYPCPNSNSQLFEGNSTTCLCSVDIANRAPRCDEAWVGPAGGRFEKIRAYSKEALLKAGFSESSTQVQKAQNLPIVISGLNLEGAEGCTGNLPPPRDTKKFVEFLGLTAEKGLTSIMPCCSLAQNNNNYWALEPTSGYLKTLYFYRKHFGDNILNTQKDPDVKVYASKNQSKNKLSVIISGIAGNTYDLDFGINPGIDYAKLVKVFTPDTLTDSFLRSFAVSTARFTYTLDSDIVSLEIPLTSAILPPSCTSLSINNQSNVVASSGQTITLRVNNVQNTDRIAFGATQATNPQCATVPGGTVSFGAVDGPRQEWVLNYTIPSSLTAGTYTVYANPSTTNPVFVCTSNPAANPANNYCTGNADCNCTATLIVQEGPTITPIPACPRKAEGDANCDGYINGIDLGILILYQCIKTSPAQVCADLRADFNNNGQVDSEDRQTIISRL